MKGESKLGDYTLAYDFNALCLVEDEIGPMGQAMAQADLGSLKAVRALVWAGLQTHHKSTIEDAGNIIQEVGLEVAREAMEKAITKAFPKPEAGKGKSKADQS